MKDILRKITEQPSQAFIHALQQAERLLKQEKASKNKLYRLHKPDVECISKGKSAKLYEFGVKVSVAQH